MPNPIHLMLHHHLSTAAQKAPDKCAVSDASAEITYGALHSWAMAGALRLQRVGVVPGDRVVMVMRNSIEFAKNYWAVIYAGAVVVPVSPDLKADKLAYILQDCTPRVVLADPDLAKDLRALACDVCVLDSAQGENVPLFCQADGLIDQALGCIIYTSGSTGRPKGVMLSHQNLVTASRSVAEYLGYRDDDRIFVSIPLTFDYGMHQLTMAALVGATVVIERDFSKPLFALDRAAKAKATVFPVVPTMVPLIAKLAGRFDLSAVRLLSSTAAALDPSLIDMLSGTFPQATIYSMYGLTECHRCTFVPPARLEEKKASVGIAIPNTELWVVDAQGQRHRRDAEGELVIRGATVMKGYWNAPEKTAECLKPGLFAGEYVFHTGDICRLDADGYVHFVARKDDILKVRGEKVAPKEVEDALRQCPDVVEAIVYGEPDAVSGQAVRAAVTLHEDADSSPESLRKWCSGRLEPVAVPKTIDIVPAFTLTSNGKIDRQQFRAKPASTQPEKEMMT